MGRRVVTEQLQATTGGEVDGYTDRLVKYIPGDIVAAWLAIRAAIASSDAPGKSTVYWISFVACLVITLFWTRHQTSAQGKPPATLQIIASTIAFAVWSLALGEPFSSLSWYHPLYASLALIFYTLIAALVTPKA